MSQGIPVRLSVELANRARETAKIQDRSLTEQVEHWARLGQIVESAALSSTVSGLKSVSYDERLSRALDAVDTSAARARAARSIAHKDPIRYGTTVDSPKTIVKLESNRPRRRK